MSTSDKQSQSLTSQIFLASLLIAAGVTLRLYFQHIPNFAPVAALALFAGYYFRSAAVAIAVPLCVMLISDQVIGGYSWPLAVTVYAMLGIPVALRSLLRRNVSFQATAESRSTSKLWLRNVGSIFGCCLGASLLFFFVTNLAVWQFTSIYERSMAGLLQCFVSAIPFFRYTLMGDLSFATALFGGYALATSLLRSNSFDNVRYSRP